MSEGDTTTPELKARKLPIPASILVVGTTLWKALDVAGRIDFVLRIEDQTFAAIFQSFVSYGWLVLTLVAAIWGFLAYRKHRDVGDEAGFKATPGMVVAIGILAFMYGVLLTVNATGRFRMWCSPGDQPQRVAI